MVYTRPGRPPLGETPVTLGSQPLALGTVIAGGAAGLVAALATIQGVEKVRKEKMSQATTLGIITSGAMLGPVVVATLADTVAAGPAGAMTNAVDTWWKTDARYYLLGALGAGVFTTFMVNLAQSIPKSHTDDTE